MTLADLVVCDLPPHAFVAHADKLQAHHVLIRPWVPKGMTPGGIHWARRETNPPVHGWLLACVQADIDAEPDLRPGCMVIFRRHSGDLVGRDRIANPAIDEIGLQHSVLAVHIESIDAVLDPAPIPLVW